jgi:hypothetical protein
MTIAGFFFVWLCKVMLTNNRRKHASAFGQIVQPPITSTEIHDRVFSNDARIERLGIETSIGALGFTPPVKPTHPVAQLPLVQRVVT